MARWAYWKAHYAKQPLGQSWNWQGVEEARASPARQIDGGSNEWYVQADAYCLLEGMWLLEADDGEVFKERRGQPNERNEGLVDV